VGRRVRVTNASAQTMSGEMDTNVLRTISNTIRFWNPVTRVVNRRQNIETWVEKAIMSAGGVPKELIPK